MIHIPLIRKDKRLWMSIVEMEKYKYCFFINSKCRMLNTIFYLYTYSITYLIYDYFSHLSNSAIIHFFFLNL